MTALLKHHFEEHGYATKPFPESLRKAILAHIDADLPQELSKGSCIIFNMNLVHRGPTHNKHELRISAELCFIVK